MLGWVLDKQRMCHYVVTPNLDHVVLYQEMPGFRDAYKSSSLVTADGNPLIWASRLFSKPLPERVTGSDLVPDLFTLAEDNKVEITVFLLGAAAGVAEVAQKNIENRWNYINVTGVYSPPLGFEHNEDEKNKIISLINEKKPDLLIVGLGAPKQEMWAKDVQEKLNVKALLCVGATIDFLAGERKRAPLWVQKIALEWFYRMMSEPGRLGKRYLINFIKLPTLLWNEWRNKSN